MRKSMIIPLMALYLSMTACTKDEVLTTIAGIVVISIIVACEIDNQERAENDQPLRYCNYGG